MEEKLFSDLTEQEKKIDNYQHVYELKEASLDIICFCKKPIKKGRVIYVSSFCRIDCCSVSCCHDVFRDSMD